MESGVYSRYSDYLETYVQLGLASGNVVAVEFTDAPDGDEVEEGEVGVVDAVFEYLSGGPSVDAPYALTVSGLERRALERTRDVPYGSTVSYEEFARSIGAEEDVEEVQKALQGNPVPIVLPCHRVVADDGVGGYTGPRDVKRRLLDLEG